MLALVTGAQVTQPEDEGVDAGVMSSYHLWQSGDLALESREQVS